MLGIGANSQHAAQAWDFISWTLSEETQVNVVAKNKNITVRRDLDDNVYAQQDPRLVTFTKLARHGPDADRGQLRQDLQRSQRAVDVRRRRRGLRHRRRRRRASTQHNGDITESLASD